MSLSARRAWIEICFPFVKYFTHCRSLSARRAWIEIIFVSNPIQKLWSLSARRAWIEIY